MNHQVRQHARLLEYSLIASLISSASLLLCIFAVKTDLPIYLIVIPSIFWLGLIAEQFFFWKASFLLKRMIDSGQVRKINLRFGIISFLQTKLGAVADLIFLVSLIIFTVLLVCNWGKESIQFIVLFLMVLSFRIHYIANGKNYWYKKYLSRRSG